MRKWHFLAAAAAVAATPAWAEQTGAGQAAEPDKGAQEIVVTALRKEQGVLDVPLSISAMSGDDLAKKGIRNVVALQFTEPGYLPSDSVGFTQIFVRGVGNSVFGYADPTVPIYIDDVPRLYPTMNAQFFDVERIELLKGAQGGLYGRNATGGVLNIVTRQPQADQIAADLQLSYGEKRTFEAAGYLNVPIVADKVALSLSGQRNTHAGYVKVIGDQDPYRAEFFPSGSYLGTAPQTAAVLNSGVNPPKTANDQDLWTVGGKLLIKPNDSFKLTFAADYSRKHDRAGTGLVNITPAFQQGTVSFFLNNLFAIPTLLPAGFIHSGNGAKFTNSLGQQAHNNLDDWGVSGTAVGNGPGFDVTSITAYRNQKQTNLVDINGINVALVNTISTFRKHFFYQELRLVSTGDGPLQWLGGATYLKNHIDSDVRTAILTPLSPGTATHAIDDIENWTVYAQLGYDITDALNLAISGRYIHEQHATDFANSGERVDITQKKFIPSATLSYRLAQGGTVYARWARGFKAGGVNTVQPPSVFPTGQGLIFAPEQVDTFEAGIRAALFDRKVRFTSAIFYNDYKNLQVVARARPEFPQIIFAIVNAPKARTWGAEGSLSWRASDALTLGVNAGYLNAKYIKYQIASTVLQTADLDGTPMINSPKIQLSFTGDLDQPMNDDFRLVGNVVVSHVSEVLFQPSQFRPAVPDATGPAYWLVNARLGVRTADDRYGLAVFANNVFNEGYFVGGNTSSSFGTNLVWGNPRIVGIELTARFR